MMSLMVLRAWDRRSRKPVQPRWRRAPTTSEIAHAMMTALRASVPAAQLDSAIAIAAGERQPQGAAELAMLRQVLETVVAVIRRIPVPRRAAAPARRAYSD
jgi:hypothetical protein